MKFLLLIVSLLVIPHTVKPTTCEAQAKYIGTQVESAEVFLRDEIKCDESTFDYTNDILFCDHDDRFVGVLVYGNYVLAICVIFKEMGDFNSAYLDIMGRYGPPIHTDYTNGFETYQGEGYIVGVMQDNHLIVWQIDVEDEDCKDGKCNTK